MTAAGTTSGPSPARVGFGATIGRGVVAGLASGTIWWLVELAVNWAFGGVIPLSQALTVLALDVVIAGLGGLLVGGVLAAPFGALIAKRVNPDTLLTFVGALLTLTCGFGLVRALI